MKSDPKVLKVIGLMSGTSLDGLDIVAVNFFCNDESGWQYDFIKGVTINYDNSLRNRLKNAHYLGAFEFCLLDRDFGSYCGQEVSKFMNELDFKPDFISSHGHTVFHQPENQLTFQIGHGAAISGVTGIPVISDFRSLDVALSGQGAPLVPAGDEILFNQFAYCLNLGGFANISFSKGNKRIAFDICPVNIVLNPIAASLGFDFDKDGEIASMGKIIPEILDQLNNLDFYHASYPKSLGKEWVEQKFLPVYSSERKAPEDLLRTLTEHSACQIARQLKQEGRVLATGGGVFNLFLLKRIKEISGKEIMVPDENLARFKEAIIFGLLGVLRWNRQINTFSTVTGAKKDSCGGAIYFQ